VTGLAHWSGQHCDWWITWLVGGTEARLPSGWLPFTDQYFSDGAVRWLSRNTRCGRRKKPQKFSMKKSPDRFLLPLLVMLWGAPQSITTLILPMPRRSCRTISPCMELFLDRRWQPESPGLQARSRTPRLIPVRGYTPRLLRALDFACDLGHIWFAAPIRGTQLEPPTITSFFFQEQ
jgi:hypothetical protein